MLTKSQCSLAVVVTAFVLALAAPVSALNADITVDTSVADTWIYTVWNNEPPESPDFIWTFKITFDAPISNVVSPNEGWTIYSDYSSYVTWMSEADPANDLAPGASLGGFSIASANCVSADFSGLVDTWNHVADEPGSSLTMNVAAPQAVVPEVPPLGVLSMGLCQILAAARYGSSRFHNKRGREPK